jgi:hypothetical protein
MVLENRKARTWLGRDRIAGVFSETFVCEKLGGANSEETAVHVGFLTDPERERLDCFSSHVVAGDIEAYFTRNRDDLLRVAGSLERGWVTASLLIGKLQPYPRTNRLTQALQGYGRLVKTVFISRYLEIEQLRLRINTQLNKGEAVHGLRAFLLFAKKGVLRTNREEELRNQASCLSLVTNAVVTWNTVYMAAVIDQLRAKGRMVKEEEIARLSPARYEHTNPYGKYRFEVEEGLYCFRLRPLLPRTEHPSC